MDLYNTVSTPDTSGIHDEQQDFLRCESGEELLVNTWTSMPNHQQAEEDEDSPRRRQQSPTAASSSTTSSCYSATKTATTPDSNLGVNNSYYAAECTTNITTPAAAFKNMDQKGEQDTGEDFDFFCEFDEHIFHPDFPKCCSKHKRENLLGYHCQEEIRIHNEDQGQKKHHEEEQKISKNLASSTSTSSGKTTMRERQQQVQPPPLLPHQAAAAIPSISPFPDGNMMISSSCSAVGNQPSCHDHNHGDGPRHGGHGHGHDFKNSPLLTESTMEALSILKQIEEVMIKLDYDAECRKVYLRLQRKLHRNVHAAGKKSEESRRRVEELKDRLF